MFDYSLKWLVSFERYEELRVEQATLWDKKHIRDKLHVKFPPGHEDSADKRYFFISELVDKRHCHIKKFINHLIDEGNRIFAGTETADTWCLYGDGLVQYWTPGNMAYLRERGFADRLWCSEGSTNSDNRYARKVTGNSPEVNVGTDNAGFRDLGNSMRFHVGLSFLYEVGDQRKFSLGTVPNIVSTMKRYFLLIGFTLQLI